MRKVAGWVLGLLLGAAVWSGLWLYASRQASARADAWIAAEADQGRTWTCPDKTVGGYPFAITIACTDPTYSGEALGQAVAGSLAHAVAEASLFHPRSIALTLTSPFAYQTSDRQTDVKATWETLRIDLEDLPDPDVVTLDGAAVAVDGTFGQAGHQGGMAARLATRFTLTDGSGAPGIDFRVVVDGAPVPALDALLGGTVPLALDLTGQADRAAVGDAKTPEDVMERWRLAGGHIALGPSHATRGASTVSATGALGLDEQHRPRGRLAAEFVGLEPVLHRFGISGNLAAAGSLLSTLFGGPRPGRPSTPGALALQISAKDGRLSIGPIRTSIMVPALY